MKTNKDYMLREIAGESLLIPTGTASQKLNGMIRLTETAVFIWKQVDTAADLAEIVRRIREEWTKRRHKETCMDSCGNFICLTW